MRHDPLYLIALLPPPEIRDEITAFKHQIAQKWGARHALKSPPHITLQPPFGWPDKQLPALSNSLAEFARQQAPFSVQLKNFGAFPPRVIFVEPLKNNQLERLFKNLISWLHAKFEFVDNRNNRSFHPHITIAHRDLKDSDFPEVWAAYRELPYERVFKAMELSLLKHADGEWHIYRNFKLG